MLGNRRSPAERLAAVAATKADPRPQDSEEQVAGAPTGYYYDKDGDVWFRSNGHWRFLIHYEVDRKGRYREIFQEQAKWTVHSLITSWGPFTEVRDPVVVEAYDQIRRMWRLGEYQWKEEVQK